MPLQVTLDELRYRVGRALSFSRGTYASMSTEEQNEVDQVIRRGLRQFYYPPPDDNGHAHVWSFMSAEGSIILSAPYSTGTVEVVDGVVTLTGGTFPDWAASGLLSAGGNFLRVASRDSGTQITLVDTGVDVASGSTYTLVRDSYNLADDYEGMVNAVIHHSGRSGYEPVQITTEAAIRSMQSEEGAAVTTDGLYCQYAAIVPRITDPAIEGRWSVILWPAQSASAVVRYRYIRAMPDLSDGNGIYPSGGTMHSETIIASCLAVAEDFGETPATRHRELFAERLRASIALDRRGRDPSYLGYNGNGGGPWSGSSEGSGQFGERTRPSTINVSP